MSREETFYLSTDGGRVSSTACPVSPPNWSALEQVIVTVGTQATLAAR